MSQPPVGITGVRLNAFKDRVWVKLEINGQWVTVVSDYFTQPDCVISHIVEPAGIRAAMAKHQTDTTG